MRKKLSFTNNTKTEKEAHVDLQVAAVIPTTTYYNNNSVTTPPHLRARVPIQSIEIPAGAATVVTPPPPSATTTTTTTTAAQPRRSTMTETSVSSSHSSSAAVAVAHSSNKIVAVSERRDGVQERSSSCHRHRSRSPFKLFRRPFQNINKASLTSSSSSQSVPVLSSTTTRDDGQQDRHLRMTRSVDPHTSAKAASTLTPTATATAAAGGHYEKEKFLHQQQQQDYTEVTESSGTASTAPTTATSTVSERAARRQQLIATESHPHALTTTTTTRRSVSTSAVAAVASADVPASTGQQRKHSGTAAFMGSRNSRRSRSSKDVADDVALGSSSLDTEEDLREQEAAAAAAAAASGRSKSKSSSSSSRHRQHSSSSSGRNKTKKVPRVKESRIVWTKGMQQDYQQRHEAAAKAAAEAAANNNDGTDKSLSTITLTANTSKYQQQQQQQQQQYKLYLLLLNPTSKIFELIQLIYAPATTTIGDIIKLIPPNATEPALASQQYTGLTRPKRSSPHFMNLSMLASNYSYSSSSSPSANNNCLQEEEEGIPEESGHCQGQQSQLTAGIGHGEIMLAIPHGFTPQHVIRLAKQILANPRIQALLHAANPLHNKHGGHYDRQSRQHHHHRKSSSCRHHSSSLDSRNGVDDSGSPTRTSPRDGLLVRRNTMESVHEEYATQPATPVREVVPDNIKAAATAGIPIVAVTPSPMKKNSQAALYHHGYDDYYQKSTTTTTHDQTTPVHSNASAAAAAAGAGYSAAHHAAVSSSLPPPESRDYDSNVFGGATQQLQQQRMSLDSFIRVNNQAAAAVLQQQQLPLPALGGTYEEASVDMSYSSWSQSVDSSFSSLVSTSMRSSSSSSLRSNGSSFRSARSMNMSHNNENNNSYNNIIGNAGFQHRSTTVTTTAYLTNSRRQRHVKFVKHVKGMALVTFGFMVAFYFVDPAGYAATRGGGGGVGTSSAAAAAAAARLHLKHEQPLGMCGTFQALLVMFFLVKFQLFLQVSPPSAEDGGITLGDEDTSEYQYKCPFLQATTVGMERLRKQLRRHRRRQLQQRTQKRY